MERTTIFAHSDKLILNPHSNVDCPNCARYLTEIDALKAKLKDKIKEVEIARPILQKIAQN